MEKHEASTMRVLIVFIAIFLVVVVFQTSSCERQRMKIKGEIYKTMIEHDIVPQSTYI